MIENFASNLVQLRKEKGWNQKTLAKKIGVSTTSLSNIEKGLGYPTFKNLEKISQVLNANAIELFGTAEEKEFFSVPKIMENLDEGEKKAKQIFQAVEQLKELEIDVVDEEIDYFEFFDEETEEINYRDEHMFKPTPYIKYIIQAGKAAKHLKDMGIYKTNENGEIVISDFGKSLETLSYGLEKIGDLLANNNIEGSVELLITVLKEYQQKR